MRCKPALYEIDEYVARGEAKVVFTKQRRIEGFACCICPEGGGKRHSPALALRHFKTAQHRCRARWRRRFARDDANMIDASDVLGDTPGSQAIDDMRGVREAFPDSTYEAEAASQADQVVGYCSLHISDAVDLDQSFDFDRDVDVDEPAGHSRAMTPCLSEGDDLHDDVEFGEGVDRIFTDDLESNDCHSFDDLEEDEICQNAMANSAPLSDVSNVFKKGTKTVRCTSSSMPGPTDKWHPFPGPKSYRHRNSLTQRPHDGDIMFDDHGIQDSDEDREEAISLGLVNRGLYTDPDMIGLEKLRKADDSQYRDLWRGLQIVLARLTHPLDQPGLDSSVELQMDLSKMKVGRYVCYSQVETYVLIADLHHSQRSFRPYVKAIVALPRLCSFYKGAQDAVAKKPRPHIVETLGARSLAMADARSDYIGHVSRGKIAEALQVIRLRPVVPDQLNKISDQINEQHDPISLMTAFLDNSLTFCDEHIMFWCLGVTFIRTRNAKHRDAKDKACRAYEEFLSGVADEIAAKYLDDGVGGTFDWRAYIWNTYVEPLRKESLSRTPALRSTITWHQPTGRAFLSPADQDTDSRLLGKIDKTNADFCQVVAVST
ncbi:BZ3500_MvSof-1268-A1-R1_Chr1-2g01315 [Microbotryum saponariae]|uniref:BZ3500_MvSof-1268-A1-R1_Chr1-2g01315 protein n=1 Tax=Microbotryum saponariae TaxID=289078 RepID=A0A2X0MXQ2_9BASI|nr:BZ3500_MvSof-1268-A1-R1_Chr1-2g01315 [Microbotryum saponariae]SCZ97075.1 BZ3501_MvSof-1269-A2-R1_Chr1-2g00914 [Microbotryum saponariae]